MRKSGDIIRAFPMAEKLTFDHYEVLTRDDGSLFELGRGAMGITYKAFDTNLRVNVALKVINATFLNSESRSSVSCARRGRRRNCGIRTSPRSFISGRARTRFSTRWSLSTARRSSLSSSARARSIR